MKSPSSVAPSGRDRQSSDARIVSCLIAALGAGLFTAPVHSAANQNALPDSAERETVEEPPPVWNFELLPKGFQKNPVLNMTVVTEFTPAGRTVRAISPAQPMYYVFHDSGLQSRGQPVAGENTPPPAELSRVLNDVLSRQGLLHANTTAHPPEVALFYSWGAHNAPDRTFALLFPEAAYRAFIERATLVGGRAFAKELDSFRSADPLTLLAFVGRERTHRFMIDQAQHDLHYVVVSAYDFDSLARGERRLLWRTTMTVEGVGLSMADTLRPLVVTAGPYLGRELPAMAMRRRVKKGSVELGPIRVIDEDVFATSER